MPKSDNRPDGRQDGRGAERDAVGCGILLRFASIEPSLTEVNCGSLPLAISFSFRPTPSCLLFLSCEPQIIPRPQVGGRANRRSISDCGRLRNQPAFRHTSSAHSRCSFAIARSCSLLLGSGCFRSFPLIPARFRSSTAFRSPSRRPIRKAWSEPYLAGSSLPACFNRHGKGGAGMPSCRFLPVPPVSPFRLPCLLVAFSFPYLPGMVIGYSVATVIYFS